MLRAIILCLVCSAALAADYTRDGGTADWMCCTDKACTQIVSQKADPVRAFKDCEAKTDADGITRYVRSNAFRVTKVVVTPPPPPAGTARLNWTVPTQNTDGSALTDLVGFRIVYGQSPTTLNGSVQVGPGVNSYTVTGLAPGVWYFAVITVASSNQSAPSNVASRTL